MFGGGRDPRRSRFLDGPVAIPRGERLKLRRASSGSGSSSSDAGSMAVTARLPSPKAAAANPAWFGQTYEYAAGVALREHVLIPTLQHQHKSNHGYDDITTTEPARLLSYFAKGELILVVGASGGVHLGSIARVTGHDGLTLAEWWDVDKTLVYTGGRDDWSEWWVNRCNLFDPGCEMFKLKTSENRTLGMVYFERNVAHEGQRLTLIRGMRIDPSLNPEAIRRASRDRNEVSKVYIEFPGVATALLYHVLFSSMHYGTQGVAVNSPKDDATEDFYQKFMGIPESISQIDGRRFFRIGAEERFALLRTAFSDQIGSMLLLKEQLLGKTEKDAKSEELIAQQIPGATNGGRLISSQRTVDVTENSAAGKSSKDTVRAITEESINACSSAVPPHVKKSTVVADSCERMAADNLGKDADAGETATPQARGKDKSVNVTEDETATLESHGSGVSITKSEPPKVEDNGTISIKSLEAKAMKAKNVLSTEPSTDDEVNNLKFSVESVGALTKRALETVTKLQLPNLKKQKVEKVSGATEENPSQEGEGSIFDDPDDSG